MNINEVILSPFTGQGIEQKKIQDPFQDFRDIFSQSIKELNRLSEEANQKIQEMVVGEVDLHEAMISLEKAGISLKLMLLVRNKLLAAYEEIMRMQFS